MSGVPQPPSDHRDIPPLYRELLWVEDPRLAFIGLPYRVVPFPQFEIQAKYWTATLTGRIPLPPKQERQTWLATHEANLRAAGVPESRFYEHGDRQFTYYDDLAAACGAPPLPSEFAPLNATVAESRHASPHSYRDPTS